MYACTCIDSFIHIGTHGYHHSRSLTFFLSLEEHPFHQQTGGLLCQIKTFKLYYTYYVTIMSYYVTVMSIKTFTVFRLLCHIMSCVTNQLLYQLCHYSNLQPLSWEDNMKKSNKIINN